MISNDRQKISVVNDRYGSVVHIRLIDGKIRIQYDGTEEGVATDQAITCCWIGAIAIC
ncbi:element excision factor XisI family protein [Thiothrix caldifontis]|uniref:element excision factor XisI family protein n=1 Tax=Thiothrix caldifontis TaxID=525918 RepID=UPI001114EEF3|nr:element excision factor XisI family protein [Thiothrix caldifontis]